MTAELQRRAVARHEQLSVAYKRVVFLGGALVTALMGLLVYLLVRWSHFLFR